jgi:hypothetical protein
LIEILAGPSVLELTADRIGSDGMRVNSPIIHWIARHHFNSSRKFSSAFLSLLMLSRPVGPTWARWNMHDRLMTQFAPNLTI